MDDRLVINRGPLIILDRIKALDVAGQLPYHFLCPQEVRAELDQGEILGHRKIAPPWVAVYPLRGAISPMILSSLDIGEAAVIQLALEEGIVTVCIDEWKGRRVALSCGLRVTGVLGLLGRAKKVGIIKAVKPFVERANEAGVHYHPDLVRTVLESVGEEVS